MPKTANPPAAKGRRRGKHREKRLKMLEAKPHRLAGEAPVGEYLVDAVALELFFRGASASTRGEGKFVRLVREDVSLAAKFAAMSAKIHLRWRPKKLHLTKRFFEDLRHIQKRIRRNKGLSPLDLQTSLNQISIPNVRAEALQSTLGLADIAIRDYLERYRTSSSEPGNYDWLTRRFIDELFELWCGYVRVELSNEAKVFNKLLAAAWRDVRFPTREQDGQRLEDWLADRVRKHFSDEICSSRRDRQEFTLLLDNERAGC
jgi:hypothetical protein